MSESKDVTSEETQESKTDDTFVLGTTTIELCNRSLDTSINIHVEGHINSMGRIAIKAAAVMNEILKELKS